MWTESLRGTLVTVRGIKQHGTFVRNVFATFSVQVLMLLLATVTAGITARWLGPEGKGLLSLALLVPHMLGLLLNGGVGVANVYFASSKKLDVRTLTAHSVTFAGISTLLGGGIIVALLATHGMDALVPGVPYELLWFAAAGLPIVLSNTYFSAILQGLQRITRVNGINLLQSTATLAFTFLLVAGFHLGPAGAILAVFGAGTLALAWTVHLLSAEGVVFRPMKDLSAIRSMLRFGLKGHIGNLLQFVNYRLDVFLANYFLGPAEVGIYSVSVGLAELLWYLPNAAGFVIFPKAAATDPESMNPFTERVLRVTLGVSALGGLGLIVIGKPLIRQIFSSSFDGAYLPMAALLPGVVLLGGAKVLANDIAGRGHPEYNSVNSGLTVILTIGLNLVLIPAHGVLGAAVASSIAYGVTFLMAFFFHRRMTRRERGSVFA